MKNKKLFAILTLVCFMFTLMPVAAFAAPADSVLVYDGSKFVEDVYVEAPATVLVKAASETANVAYYAVDADGKAVQVQYGTVGNNGKASFTFKNAGTYTIYGVLDNMVDTDGNTVTDLEEVVKAANSLTDELTVAAAVAKIEAQLADQIIKTAATVVVEAKEANYTIAVSTPAVAPKADSGFSTAGNAQVTVTLKNNGNAVVGKVPTITAPDYVTVVPANAKKVVTDAAGNITYNISADRAGDFEVVFSYEDADDKTVAVNAYDYAIANVTVAKEAANAINKVKDANGEVRTGAAVKFTDANGSAIVLNEAVSGGYAYSNQVKVSVVSQPAASKLTANNFKLVPSATADATDLVVKGLTSDLKVGTYKVKLALENGKYVVVAFEAAKMGDVVGIRFIDPAKTVALGDELTAASFAVEAYDANGVVKALANGHTATGDYFTVVAQGKALDTTTAVFKVINDEKYVGTTVTVLAKTGDNKFVATTEVEVVDAGQKVVYKDTTAEVGVTTTLVANVLDAKDNKVVVPGLTTGNVKFVVLEKPANAYVNTVASAINGKDIKVSFLASVAGEYKIQTIVLTGNNEYVTGIETITVGANADSFKDIVVMSIGANKVVVNNEVVVIDCAPIVENNRTFVPFRALIQAFGAEVAYDEATQAVTATLNDTTVVMTIGSAEYTVNGEVKTADVAPFINGSRTMVPVRFVAEAFGINVTPVYGDNGATVDVLFAK